MTRFKFGERRYRTQLKYFNGWPDLIALVDILFLSLLFFVLATNIVRVSGVKVALPKMDTSTMASLGRFVISVAPPERNGDGVRIYFQEKPCDNIRDLSQKLSELCVDRKSKPSVIIRADRRVSFEEVAKVMDAAKRVGISCFIAVEVPDPAEEPDATYEK